MGAESADYVAFKQFEADFVERLEVKSVKSGGGGGVGQGEGISTRMGRFLAAVTSTRASPSQGQGQGVDGSPGMVGGSGSAAAGTILVQPGPDTDPPNTASAGASMCVIS